MDVDPGARRRPRVDDERAADQAQPLPHADQPEPPVAIDGAEVEPGPIIGDPQGNPVLVPAQLDASVPGAAVFDDVAQGLLGDPVEAQGRVVWD